MIISTTDWGCAPSVCFAVICLSDCYVRAYQNSCLTDCEEKESCAYANPHYGAF